MSHLFPDDVVAKARENGIDDDIPDFDTPVTLPEADRSTLESFANCPAMARYVQTGRVITASKLTEAGTAVHDAFSATITEYLQVGEELSLDLRPTNLVDVAMEHLLKSRPDVQPEAIRAAMPSLYSWARYLFDIMPSNILRYDGGKEGRSGQLGWNVPHLGKCVTAELDLLHATASPAVLCDVDYKSGWKVHTEASIADSFQFTTHAVVVFRTFSEVVEAVDVRVWNTRTNDLTKPVRFYRERLPQYEARVVSALEILVQYEKTAPEECPTWPTVEKCRICPAARLCPHPPAESCANDPAAFVLSMHNFSVVLDAMKDEAAAYVDANGDIEYAGLCFGRAKPKSTKKPKSELYTTKGASDAEDQAE